MDKKRVEKVKNKKQKKNKMQPKAKKKTVQNSHSTRKKSKEQLRERHRKLAFPKIKLLR